MVDVWVVVGKGNMRKSSTIRALTGAFGERPRWSMAYVKGGNIDTYVCAQSPQEIGYMPPAFIKRVKKFKVNKLIVALRDQGKGKFPDANTYLAAFKAAGWNIKGGAFLGSCMSTLPQRLALEFANPTNIPCNKIASDLRKKWRIL